MSSTRDALDDAILREATTWRLDRGSLSARLNLRFSRHLNRRVASAIAANARLDESIQSSARQLARSPASHSDPFLAWIEHRRLRGDVISRLEWLRARDVLALVHRCDEPPPRRVVTASMTGDGVWAEPAVASIERELGAVRPIRLSLRREPAPRVTALLDDAAELVQTHWPECYDEMGCLIRALVLVDGDGLSNSSTPMAFGAIFLGCDRPLSLLGVVDSLVHETAHHSLLVKGSFVKYAENTKQKLPSPLRTDPRPVNGILHATFVLVRTVEMLRRLDRSRAIPEGAVAEMLDDYETKALVGVTTLREHSTLTTAGYALLSDMECAVDRDSKR